MTGPLNGSYKALKQRHDELRAAVAAAREDVREEAERLSEMFNVTDEAVLALDAVIAAWREAKEALTKFEDT